LIILPPKLASIISRKISYVIIFISAGFYCVSLVTESAEKVTVIGLTVFGIIAGLSALCLGFVSAVEESKDKSEFRYAGEKYLHSSLLLAQTIFLKYIEQNILSLNFIKAIPIVYKSSQFILEICLFGSLVYATYFCLYATKSLNDILWERYELRRQKSDALYKLHDNEKQKE
jgi:hypothetical protein